MKILLTNSGPWGTGSFTIAKALLDEYVKLGHQVKLFFPDSKMPSSDIEYYYNHKDLFEIWKFPIKNEDVHIESFPLIIPVKNPRSPHIKTLSEFSSKERNAYCSCLKRKLKEVIENFKPDVIECQHIWDYAYTIHQLGHPYFCHAHHIDQLGFTYNSKIQSKILDAAKGAKFIFAISNFVKKEVEKLYQVPSSKIAVIYGGINQNIFKKFLVNKKKLLDKLNLNIDETTQIINFVGTLSSLKGIENLLKADKLIPERENIHFLCIGGSNKSFSQFDKKLFSKRISFLGYQTQEVIAEIHNISKINILPSKSEGFGLAALEAMACGLPVITTNQGGTTEFIVGYALDCSDPQKIANSILKMLHLPHEQYIALSQQAIKTSQNFLWEKIAKQHLEYYLKIK